MTELITSLLGTPYVPGGFTPSPGFFCWGFCHWLYGKAGYYLPKEVYSAGRFFREVKEEEKIKWLDIVVFTESSFSQRHVGVVLDYDRIAQTAESTNGVAICRMSRSPFNTWRRRFGRLKSIDH